MTEAELKTEALIQRHLEKFGVDDPACQTCGENHPLCLHPQNHDDTSTILCWNCWTIEQWAKLDPAVREKRRLQKLRELAPHMPICLSCGATDVCVLELHHWLQARYSDQTQVNCENCHRLFNALQYAYHPPVLHGKIGTLAYAAKIFFALADEYQLRTTRRQKLIAELELYFQQPSYINKKMG